jgi:hypothetical protein
MGGLQINAVSGFGGSPREVGLPGFICRALDGKPQWWPNIVKYVESQSTVWLARHLPTGTNGSEPHLGSPRDAAYMLMFNAMLGAVHPDAAVRTKFVAAAVNYATNAVIRKRTETAAGYIWKNKTTKNDSVWLTGPDGVATVPAAQPFINALVIESLIWTHRMMRFHGTTSGAEYDAIGTAIIEGVRAWFAGYRDARNGFDARLRSVAYIVGRAGDLRNGNVGPNGLVGQPLILPVPPDSPDFAVSPTATTWDEIVNSRQLNADGFGSAGYAFALTGDPFFHGVYDEGLDSCFGDMASNKVTPNLYGSLWMGPEDGSAIGRQSQKNWNQHHGRNAHRGIGWIIGGLESFP